MGHRHTILVTSLIRLEKDCMDAALWIWQTPEQQSRIIGGTLSST